MMNYFLNSADPHFFDDIRGRILFALLPLEQCRTLKKCFFSFLRHESPQEDEDSMDGVQSKDAGHLDLVLLLLQNLCEGQFVQMKVIILFIVSNV
jgi:hypothetical protein